MDSRSVKDRAARHAAKIAAAKSRAAGRQGPHPVEVRRAQFGALWERLDAECRGYVDAYNEALDTPKLQHKNHEFGINVEVVGTSRRAMRLHADPRATTLERAVIDVDDDRTMFETAIGEDADGSLVCRVDGKTIEPEKLMTVLLDRFTDAVADAECEEA
jgi:hypothetical protein